MARHVAWSVLLLAVLASPAAAQNPPRSGETFRVHPQAKAAIDQIRSPYCPGLMLEVCTSSGGAMLRDSIERMAERGMKADSIVDIIIGEYGEQWRAKPKRSGSGLLAWLIPPAALLVGGGVVAGVLGFRRNRRGDDEVISEPALGADDEERLRRAIHEEEEKDAPVF